MQILSYLITGIILFLTDYFLLDKNNKPLVLLKKFLNYVILFNIVSLTILKYFFKQDTIIDKSFYEGTGFLKYIGLSLILGFIILLIKAILTSKIKFTKVNFEKVTEKSSKKYRFMKVLAVIFFAIASTFVFFSTWFTNYFGEITPEQFLFNLKSPLKGTSSDMSYQILTRPVFAIIGTTIIFLFILNFSYELFKGEKKILSQKIFKIFMPILSVLILITGVSFGVKTLKLDEVVSAYFSDSTFIGDNYKDPRDTKLSFPKKKRNLIHIYLESVENSYLSTDLGGHMNVNLMPELTELAKEGIVFSDNEGKFGGPYQTYGSSWSVASMINMGTGIPLKIPMENNSYGLSGTFLPGAINMGDILEAQGYNQTIMFGADADFGGLTTYFNSHGNFNIFDYKAAIAKDLIPSDYYVWWGYEDDKLYDYAKEELTRLHNEGKPFNFTMETADTHFPDGYLSPNAEQKHDKQYANVISYSTKEAVDFVRWIQKQPFYEDTTIVITGDHLSMDRDFFTDFDPNYRRSVFNLILNSPISTEHTNNREYAPFDMFPTILASMGIEVEGNKLGLGTNLYSGDKTLIEEKGLKVVEEELGKNSNFFNENFIDESLTSDFQNTLVTERDK